jgi:DNA-binding beta-propeller fold protein YncE
MIFDDMRLFIQLVFRRMRLLGKVGLWGMMVLAGGAVFGQSVYEGFEARLTHPLELTPDGARLVAVHSEASSLSVFDVTNPLPVRVAEIPVGLEPVSVRARTNDEAWVVNEVSDTVSVVSLASGQVTAVLPTGDEPADVVFANGKAFVTCARDNEIWVYDAVTRALITLLEVQGLYPQSLAVSEDGSRVYAVFLHSGNGTTVLKRQLAPALPAPTNTALPEAPNTALIVAATDPRINYTVLDHDVVEIDAATNQVLRYVSAVGTNLLGAAVRPGANELWVSNTEALNLVRFEPQLKGRFSLNRLSVVDLSTGSVEPKDLNPGVDYDVLPNPVAQSMALAQPSAVVFNTSGATAWTAAFASDRVAKVDAATGAVIERVDVRTGGGDSGDMRGPRGLALDENAGRLYVVNKLSETVSVIDVNSAVSTVVAEVDLSSHEPLPTQVKEGRGYLYDARLSGNGTVSCGVCHLDGDRDGLAWDLGNPEGEMQTVLGANLSVHDTRLRPRVLHPMKGPMTTQTLRGMQNGAPFHWRGDKPTIADFNPTFRDLMGGEEISAGDMAALTAYVMTIRHHPNPNRNLDRSLPTSFGEGSPVTGRDLFNNHPKSHCATCHVLPLGSDNNLDLPAESGLSQPVKTAPLRTIYQRLFYDPRPGRESLSGFGLLHDGTGFELPIGHPYVLDNLNTLQELRDVSAFMMCFDTGTALTVGHTVILNQGSRSQSPVLTRLSLMEARAVVGDCDLVVRGTWQGQARRWLFNITTQTYRADRVADGMITRSVLLNGLSGAEMVSFMGVLPGQGERLGGDVDSDGVLDGDDPNPRVNNGSPKILLEPSDRAVAPGAPLTLEVTASGEGLSYQWYRNNQVLSGEETSVFSRAVVSADDAGDYKVVVTNGNGTATSRTAKVEVYPVPVITVQPVPRKVNQGQSTSLSVTATGTGIKYQWMRGGLPVQGAEDRTLNFPSAQGVDAGNYSVVVSNGAGSETSGVVALTVVLPPSVTMTNLPAAIVGQNYTAPLIGTQEPTRFSVTGLPKGLKLSGDNLHLSGKAAVSGIFLLKIIAFNYAGSSGTAVTVPLEVKSFPTQALGVYEGVLPRNEDLNGNLGGWIKLTTSKLAAFSGTLRLGAKTHTLRGTWTASDTEMPKATLEIKRSRQTTMTVELGIDTLSRSLSGKVVDGGTEVLISGGGVLTEAGAMAGNHNLALLTPALEEGAASVPQGDGVGGFSVNAKGAVRGALRLADGSSFSMSAPLTEGGYVHVFQGLYRNTGSLFGRLKIAPASGHRLEGSELSWWKALQTAKTRSYPGGFGPLALRVHGGLHVIPAAGRTIAGMDDAALLFSHGGAPDPMTRLNVSELVFPARHPANAAITVDNPGAVVLTLQPGSGTRFTVGTTGSFAGTFTLKDADLTTASNPLRTRKVNFHGMVVDDGNGPRGYGFFNLPEMPALGPPKTTLSSSSLLSGRVRLNPLP